MVSVEEPCSRRPERRFAMAAPGMRQGLTPMCFQKSASSTATTALRSTGGMSMKRTSTRFSMANSPRMLPSAAKTWVMMFGSKSSRDEICGRSFSYARKTPAREPPRIATAKARARPVRRKVKKRTGGGSRRPLGAIAHHYEAIASSSSYGLGSGEGLGTEGWDGETPKQPRERELIRSRLPSPWPRAESGLVVVPFLRRPRRRVVGRLGGFSPGRGRVVRLVARLAPRHGPGLRMALAAGGSALCVARRPLAQGPEHPAQHVTVRVGVAAAWRGIRVATTAAVAHVTPGLPLARAGLTWTRRGVPLA